MQGSPFLDDAIDVLLSAQVSRQLLVEIRADLEHLVSKFVRDEAQQEGIPSVGRAVQQLEELSEGCERMLEIYPGGDRAEIGMAFIRALEPFLDLNPYAARGLLCGSVPSIKFGSRVPIGGELIRTTTGEDSWLNRAIGKAKGRLELDQDEIDFLRSLGESASRAAEAVRNRMGLGPGRSGRPLFRVPLRHDFVVYLLDIWERYAPGRATRGPGAKFQIFVSLMFQHVTGDPEQNHGKVIKAVIREWRSRQRPPRVGRPPKTG